MANVIDEHRLNHGIDFDSENREIKNGRLRYALNARSGTSDKDNVGAIESMRGNELIDTMPNTFRVIKSCPDIENNAIINFYYDSAGAHVIKRIFSDGSSENLINPALMASVLNFQPTDRIHNAKVVEAGFTQLLTWVTAPNGVPRLMDIDKMKFGGVYYSIAADEQYINLAKRPPLSPPDISYADDTSLFNLLDKKFYQFRYRYIYDDYQISTCSQISKLSIPDPQLLKNNRIDIILNSGHKTVTKIDVMVRIGNGSTDTGDVNPQWYIYKTINKSQEGISDNTPITINFFGSEQLTSIARIDTDTNFYSIPQLADEIEYVTDNQIILGAITEGYDNVDLNVDFETYYGPTGIINYVQSDLTNPYDFLFKSTELPVVGETVYLRFFTSSLDRDLNYPITADDLINYPANLAAKVIEIISAYGYTYTYSAGSGFGSQTDPPRIHMVSQPVSERLTQFSVIKTPTEKFLNVQGDQKSLSSRIQLEIFNTINFRIGQFQNNIYTITSVNGPPKTIYLKYSFSAKRNQASGNPLTIYIKVNGVDYASKTFTLTGSYQDFYIEHFITVSDGDTIELDAGFSSSILINCTIASGSIWILNGNPIPFVREGFKSGSEGQFGLVYYDSEGRNGGVNTDPNCKVKWDYYSDRSNSLAYEETFPIKGFIPGSSWEIKHIPPVWAKKWGIVFREQSLSFIQTLAISAATPSSAQTVVTVKSFGNYTIEKGDEVIVIGFLPIGVNSSLTYLLKQLLSVQRLYTVLDFNVSSKTITVDSNFYYLNNYSFFDLLIEIRKPKGTSNSVYFEIDQLYDIMNPGLTNRYHKGETQNQDPSNPITVPAKGIVMNGNIHYRLIDTAVTESLDISDSIESDYWDKGRVQIETQNQRQQKYGEMFRWGNALFPNTQVNNLSAWDEGNYKRVDASKGSITGLRQRGYTLDIIQWANTNKAFLGRKEITNADGNTQLVVTDNLIGIINPSEQGFGTKEPGSIVVAGNDIFFFDSLRGTYCRDSGGGIIPISKYGANRYWWDKAEMIKSDPLWEVISGIDLMYRDLYVTLKKVDDIVQVDAATITPVGPIGLTSVTLTGGEAPTIVALINSLLPSHPEMKIQLLSSGIVKSESIVTSTTGSNQINFNAVTVLVSVDAINIITTNSQTETIYFNLDENEWKSFVDLFYNNEADIFPIDNYGWVGQSFFTFLRGSTWQQNILEETGAPVYSKFFGQQRKFIAEYITNLAPDKEKVFNTHDIHGNKIPSRTELRIPVDVNCPNGMYSYLVTGNYKPKEGGIYAFVKMDGYTKGIPLNDAAERQQIGFGRPMRGRSMNVKMIYETPDMVVIWDSGIGSIGSDKS